MRCWLNAWEPWYDFIFGNSLVDHWKEIQIVTQAWVHCPHYEQQTSSQQVNSWPLPGSLSLGRIFGFENKKKYSSSLLMPDKRRWSHRMNDSWELRSLPSAQFFNTFHCFCFLMIFVFFCCFQKSYFYASKQWRNASEWPWKEVSANMILIYGLSLIVVGSSGLPCLLHWMAIENHFFSGFPLSYLFNIEFNWCFVLHWISSKLWIYRSQRVGGGG